MSPLRQLHHITEVLVGLVYLHHRELGVMTRVDVLVPEIPRDLKDFLETTDNQSFQVEFRCNPQEKLLFKEIMKCCEWSRICTAVDGLKDRGLKFKEVPLIQVPPDQGDNTAPCPEYLPALLVYNKVNISLAVPFFDIFQTMEFFR